MTEASAELLADYAEIDRQLRAAGMDFRYVGDLPNTKLRLNDQSIEALVGLLATVRTLEAREFLVRCLADKAVARRDDVLDLLVREFQRMGAQEASPEDHMPPEVAYRWVVGQVLGKFAPAKYGPVLETLADRESWGLARQGPLQGIARLRTPGAYAALVRSLKDERLLGVAIRGLSRLGDPRALPRLEALVEYVARPLAHEPEFSTKDRQSEIRREARTAIGKLRRAREKTS